MKIKSMLLKMIAVFAAMTMLLCSCAHEPKPLDGSKFADKYTDGETDYSEGFALLERMGAGWNFGNTLDAPHEGDWSPAATKANVKSVKKMGFGAIRLPVTWSEHIGPAPEYKIDDEFMDRVEEVVDWILNEDLYCILNLHHDETWIAKMSVNHDEVLNKFEKVWIQIAERFKNKSGYLIFESDNEQSFEGLDDSADESYALMNELNLRFVEIVRASGGKNSERFLGIPSVNTNSYKVDPMELPEGDGRILIAIHYYSPWAFTVNAWGAAYWGSDEDKQNVVDDLRAAYDAFDGKVPIYIGEYGAWKAHLAYRTYYTEYVIKTARSLGMTAFVWDTGGCMDRGTNEWNDEIVLKEAISAGSGQANSFVMPLELYVKNGEIGDRELEIEYNCNELVSIKNDGKELASSDYELTETGVILKKSFLDGIMTGDFGLKTTLVFEFSGGVDYELRLNYYDTPTVTKELTRRSLTVKKLPIEWNGDKVATIRGVKNSNGQSANTRDSWTKYFKGGDDFDVKEDGVYVTDEFRIMITEDITLTFEMYSGDTFEVTVKAE